MAATTGALQVVAVMARQPPGNLTREAQLSSGAADGEATTWESSLPVRWFTAGATEGLLGAPLPSARGPSARPASREPSNCRLSVFVPSF